MTTFYCALAGIFVGAATNNVFWGCATTFALGAITWKLDDIAEQIARKS